MTPMCAHQVEELRARFDGTVQVFGDFGDTAAVLLTPRGSEPLRTAKELDAYLTAHPQTCLPFWDDIHAMRVPFALGLNGVSFRILNCSLPPPRAVT